jgi:hypothetical protein
METWKDHDAAKVTGKKLRINFEKKLVFYKERIKEIVNGRE